MNDTNTQNLDPIPSPALVAAVRAVLDLDATMTLRRKAAVVAALTAPAEDEQPAGRVSEWEAVSDVAARTGVSRMTIYRYANHRLIPSRTEGQGQGVLVRERDVRAYVDAHPHHRRGKATE